MKLPFHNEHIGSLLRPQSLIDAQEAVKADKATISSLISVQQEAISAVVKKQDSERFTSITTGEFDRSIYIGGFFENLDGLELVTDPPWELYRMNAPPIRVLRDAGKKFPFTVVCVGKIRYRQSPYLEQWKYLRSLIPESRWGECKFTIPPIDFFHLRIAPGKLYPKDVYANDEAFFADLALAYQQEFKTLYDHGLRMIQIDDPTLAYFCSKDMLEGLKSDGVDPDKLLDQYLKAHNECLKDRPAGLHVGLHLCRGNFSSSVHFSEGSYESIAKKLFTGLDYDTFFLEYDSPRAGGFEPLRFLPPNKNVVLGVVSTKLPEMEDPAELKRKVYQAADIIAQGQGRKREDVMKNLAISPQCGFASAGVGGVGFTEELQWEKLRLVRDVSREIWPEEN